MTNKKAISLPDEPRDIDFEDYVAAHLQSGGSYIERSIVERSDAEILELDVISTIYDAGESPIERLIEVKSGGWGFTEIFKLSGWGKYLNIDDLTLVVCKEKPNQDFYDSKSSDIGVELCHLINNAKECDEKRLLRGIYSDPIDVEHLRFSYLLERKLTKALNHKKKSHPDRESYRALEYYYFTLHSAIFFSKNILKKVDKLYSLFKENPHISKKVSNEAVGNNFSDNHNRIPVEIFEKTFYKSKYTDLTISCYIEHRARLAILKAAVDFCLYENNRVKDRIDEEVDFGFFKYSLKSLLPDSFIKSLDEIRNDDYFHRYPVFWQCFLWIFGGFILSDYKDSEYKILSLKSGIPIDCIDRAFEVYGMLFPSRGGWFIESNMNSKIKCMKMFPVPFRGVGANYRRQMYTEDNSFDSLKVTGKYTMSNLIAWNNLAVEVMLD